MHTIIEKTGTGVGEKTGRIEGYLGEKMSIGGGTSNVGVDDIITNGFGNGITDDCPFGITDGFGDG